MTLDKHKHILMHICGFIFPQNQKNKINIKYKENFILLKENNSYPDTEAHLNLHLQLSAAYNNANYVLYILHVIINGHLLHIHLNVYI